MKDKIRYSEASKLKVMEELRDAKWKSVREAAKAYGIAEMSVYNWMRKLGFEHLKGRLIYVKTRTETDRIKELEVEVKQLRIALADEVLDHKIDEAALRLMCTRAGTTPDEVKNCYCPCFRLYRRSRRRSGWRDSRILLWRKND